MTPFTIGTVVTHTNRATGEVLRGVIVDTDPTDYRTLEFGVVVYYVRWERRGIGGGWRHDDLCAA